MTEESCFLVTFLNCSLLSPLMLNILKFGDLPKIWPNALLAEFKFGSLPERVLITLKRKC